MPITTLTETSAVGTLQVFQASPGVAISTRIKDSPALGSICVALPTLPDDWRVPRIRFLTSWRLAFSPMCRFEALSRQGAK